MAELTFDLKAPWQRQIDFFRQKLNLSTEAWDDILKEAHDRAFVVAGAMKADLLNDFRQAVDTVIAEGKSIQWFRQNFDQIVQDHGWDYAGSRNWRTRTIYQANLSTSYHAGRYQQLTDPELLAVKPFWVYHHGHPITPRIEHLSWDGMALPASDPWWQTRYTPNGFGCTCWVSAASKRDIERKGYRLMDKPPDDGYYQHINGKTGEVTQLPKGVDYGWDYAPGASVAEQLRPVIDAKIKALPPELGKALADDLAAISKPKFTPASTTKAAEAFAREANLADYVDYKGLHVDVANAWNESIMEHQTLFPELRKNFKFIGTIQGRGTRWYELTLQDYLERLRRANPGVSEERLVMAAKSQVPKPKRISGNTYAQSTAHAFVSGISVNLKWGKDIPDYPRSSATLAHPQDRRNRLI